MPQQPLFQRIDDRIVQDKEEGDLAYFQALTLKLEYLTKIVTSAVVACIGDDADRHRYSLEHRLVRANSIGEWVAALDEALVGPAAQFLLSEARSLQRELTERVGPHDWRHSAVSDLNQSAVKIGAATKLGGKVALRQFFDIGVQLRNRSRGHGAPTSIQCGESCIRLAQALETITENIALLRLSWVQLHRNLSGKYRVLPVLNNSIPFDYLRRTKDARLTDGIHLHLDGQNASGRHVHLPLLFTNADTHDYCLPNGNHRGGTFEILSYVTNFTDRKDANRWSVPPARLPKSETEGTDELRIQGTSFSNTPPNRVGYVSRIDLESRLQDELLDSARHPIISLTGPGGIGKTTIAITTINRISQLGRSPYQVVLWISARDIDLLESGPKPVSQRVFTQRDISQVAAQLLQSTNPESERSEPDSFFQECLAEGAAGPTLFVLDNFETVQNPADVFGWIDCHIRLPNKILITTRIRDFVGDFPIEIGGMLDEEAITLVDQHAASLGISNLISPSYKNAIIRESDGHPYVMKILLGQVAKEGRAVTPQRIVANSDDLLRALFERTFAALSPAGQRVFLLLTSWRVFVPEVAVEAVSLRPNTERFDVKNALEELRRFSLVDQIRSPIEDEWFIGVPLAAAMYGRRKLEVSPYKTVVEADRQLLMEFGAGKQEDIRRGVFPRIENLVQSIERRCVNDEKIVGEVMPVLEYLASRVPNSYLTLAGLATKVYPFSKGLDEAKKYMRSFLETAEIPDRLPAWQRLADLCKESADPQGEVHALCEAALLPTSTLDDLTELANRLNNRLREFKDHSVEPSISPAVREHLRNNLARVITALEKHLSKLSATDCSRLAWLHLNVGNAERAYDVAKLGLKREPTNEYCLKLVSNLDVTTHAHS